jgi:inorganic pyrophosphatase
MAKTIEAVIEIPKGSRNKYEYDEKRHVFRLDRVLYSSVHYPTDYGYIPNTRASDGDHLDILVLIEEPTFTGCLMAVRPVGMLSMRDEKGTDEKILAVAVNDPRFQHIHSLNEVPPHLLKEIENFFTIYKSLEGKETATLGWFEVDQAWQVITEAEARYRAEAAESSTGR